MAILLGVEMLWQMRGAVPTPCRALDVLDNQGRFGAPECPSALFAGYRPCYFSIAGVRMDHPCLNLNRSTECAFDVRRPGGSPAPARTKNGGDT